MYSYPRTGLSPTDMASHLTSVASSVLFKRDDQVNFVVGVLTIFIVSLELALALTLRGGANLN